MKHIYPLLYLNKSSEIRPCSYIHTLNIRHSSSQETHNLGRICWISLMDMCLVVVEVCRPPNTSSGVWLCTVCHVGDSCCGIGHTTWLWWYCSKWVQCQVYSLKWFRRDLYHQEGQKAAVAFQSTEKTLRHQLLECSWIKQGQGLLIQGAK